MHCCDLRPLAYLSLEGPVYVIRRIGVCYKRHVIWSPKEILNFGVTVKNDMDNFFYICVVMLVGISYAAILPNQKGTLYTMNTRKDLFKVLLLN